MQAFFLRFALLFLTVCGASAQNSITISGKVLDKNVQVPLESATVYLTKVSDSTVIDYTITKRDGTFSIAVKKNALPALLKISFVGYKSHIHKLDKDLSDQDLGTIRLADDVNVLGEVVVKGEAPPIRIKNDTLEFNASSFKVRPDSNVETLLKQLPGVEIDADGKITVNGKEVKQVLVNGKPFFDADGKIALQNLPSDIINKVQITDAKTKKEEIAGKPASSADASINLTIDEDKNKGVFGKFMGGMGSSKRYESSFMFNYFKNKRKVSVLGSMNNINSVGFSMNEIFDSMGGGRNTSIYTSGDGSFGINNMRFGGNKGITRSNFAGLNYGDEFFKGFDFNSNYFYMAAHTDNNNRTREITLLPDGNFTTASVAKTRDDKFSHNFGSNIEYKIDSTATLFLSPKFTRANSRFGNTYQQRAYSDNLTLNESRASTFNEQNTTGASNSIYFNKNLKRKGSRIAADFDHDNNKDEVQYLNQSETIFHDETGGGAPDRFDNRDQKRWERNLKDNYFSSFEFQQGINDSLNVHVGFEYIHNTSSFDKNTFDFDGVTQQYSTRSDSLSQYLISRLRRWNPKAGFNIERKKFSWYVDLGTSLLNFENRSLYLGNSTQLQKKYVLPFANSNFRYSFGKSTNFYASYWYSIDMPEARQILPVSDFADPLNTITGNPDLDPNTQHGLYLNLGNFDYQTKSGVNFYGGINFYENRVVATSVYDESRKRQTTYANVAGTYNAWFGGNWNKSHKNEAHSFKYSFGLNSNIERNKGFVDGKPYEANAIRLTPRMNFTYDYGELLSVNPSYNFTYGNTSYKNFTIDQATNNVHRANLQVTTYWPKHFVFGNDFAYTYNSAIADGFKKDFLLWNLSLGYNFLSDHFLAKVKIYDVLNQNQNTARTVWATGIRDEQNDVLKRYVMFSLTYKLEKFAGKKKESSNFWFWD